MSTAEKTKTPDTLAKALLAFQADAPALQKNAINPHFRNRYISLDSLMEQVLPVLNRVGLVLMQQPTTLDGFPALRTKLIHADTGDREEDVMLLASTKVSPQDQGSAITYARRYSLMAILGLVADEDDDGHKGSAGSPVGGANTVERPSTAPVAPKIPDAAGEQEGAASVGDDGNRSGAAAPSQSFKQPEGVPVTGLAQNGDGDQESRNREAAGRVMLTFGKHAKDNGPIALGTAPGSYIEWLAGEKFDPKNDDQRRVKQAALVLTGKHAELVADSDPDSDIPF